MESQVRKILKRGNFRMVESVDYPHHNWTLRVHSGSPESDAETTYTVVVYTPDVNSPIIVRASTRLEEPHVDMLRSADESLILRVNMDIERVLAQTHATGVPEDETGEQVSLSSCEVFTFYQFLFEEDLSPTDLLHMVNQGMNLVDFVWAVMWHYSG
jgi:hypothetical protein